jgi:hypothetical protein
MLLFRAQANPRKQKRTNEIGVRREDFLFGPLVISTVPITVRFHQSI